MTGSQEKFVSEVNGNQPEKLTDVEIREIYRILIESLHPIQGEESPILNWAELMMLNRFLFPSGPETNKTLSLRRWFAEKARNAFAAKVAERAPINVEEDLDVLRRLVPGIINIDTGIEESDYQRLATDSETIARFKAVLLLNGATPEERESELAQFIQDDDKPLGYLDSALTIMGANDVTAVVDGKPVHKPKSSVRTKEQAFAHILDWLGDGKGGLRNRMGYTIGVAAYDPKHKTGISTIETFDVELGFNDEAGNTDSHYDKELLMALIFGVNNGRVVNGQPIKDQISERVRNVVLNAYQENRHESALAGWNPLHGVPMNKIRKVNGGFVLDCLAVYKAFVKSVNGVSKQDSPKEFDLELQRMTHALRGEARELYDQLIRELLKRQAARQNGQFVELPADDPRMVAEMNEMNADYMKKHPGQDLLQEIHWSRLDKNAAKQLSSEYLQQLETLHRIHARKLHREKEGVEDQLAS